MLKMKYFQIGNDKLSEQEMENIVTEIKSISGVAYSTDNHSFICTEETFKTLDKKYNIEDEHYAEDLEEILVSEFYHKTIKIEHWITTVTIEISDHIDAVLESIIESEGFDFFLKADDWYVAFEKYAKELLLSLFMDEIRDECERILKEIE